MWNRLRKSRVPEPLKDLTAHRYLEWHLLIAVGWRNKWSPLLLMDLCKRRPASRWRRGASQLVTI
ncbi:hypothetical protein EYF80_064965 [Liparis tanakae]|uniref:Uncharacterized protein n=1 Tax=Liparis tanakae TaxID=230148 RepID=A0A4Z2E7Z5_9TELE|nr:hypothetical protein EYF80_064965 [Liparis tanakae]